MKLIAAFFRLIRWLNLLFIALTQCLFQYCIIVPMFRQHAISPALPLRYFSLLSLSSLLIAAGGYIINDYFDLNIDKINKPGRIVVERVMRRRWAIVWHWTLSVAGVLIGMYVGWKTGVIWLGFANIGCVIALWVYSTTFKKKLLSGNIIISLLTAWVVMVIGSTTHFRMIAHSDIFGTVSASKLLRFTFLYSGFAFIICLIREIIKDVEDIRGDERYGCRTMPIVWGVHVSKIVAGTWIGVLTSALFIVWAYILQFGWWIAALWCFCAIILPLLFILTKLFSAQSTADFAKLSSWIKFVMLTGILSMIFF
ncbi:MAG TPA: geranylgeranylglycerol-phosphate geranylgeranyltransferase [Flavitalea sp.]|nr:geranylgeranylglycerol-phosphate geranylgeranyltransferase [Flavitalea sp.]